MTVNHSCMSNSWSLLLEVYSCNKHQQPNPTAIYSAKSPLVLVGAVPKGVLQGTLQAEEGELSEIFSSQHMSIPHLAYLFCHKWQLCPYQ